MERNCSNSDITAIKDKTILIAGVAGFIVSKRAKRLLFGVMNIKLPLLIIGTITMMLNQGMLFKRNRSTYGVKTDRKRLCVKENIANKAISDKLFTEYQP